MKCLFSIVSVFKLSVCVVALFSLYSKLRFSPVARIIQIIKVETAPVIAHPFVRSSVNQSN